MFKTTNNQDCIIEVIQDPNDKLFEDIIKTTADFLSSDLSYMEKVAFLDMLITERLAYNYENHENRIKDWEVRWGMERESRESSYDWDRGKFIEYLKAHDRNNNIEYDSGWVHDYDNYPSQYNGIR